MAGVRLRRDSNDEKFIRVEKVNSWSTIASMETISAI